MAHTRLTFVPLQSVHRTDDGGYITRFNGMNAVRLMVLIGRNELILIVRRVSSGLVMTDYLHIEFVRQSTEIIHIPVIVGFGEREMLPVLPSFVPSLRQHGIDMMIVRETQVPLHIGRRSTVNRALFPSHGFHVHAPPNTYKFHRFDP